MIRLDILTAIARYESFHCIKPDLLYITEAQWDELMEGNLGDLTIIDPAS